MVTNNDIVEVQRKIIHIDMDCFYAAVEMRDNPRYRTIPIAIGGDRAHRGVLCTCNYLARTYGLKSAMPTAHALRLCPELVVLPGRMDEYQAISKQILSILTRYTAIIEPLSLDEAYLDVSESKLFFGSATLIAQDIRKTIKQELNLTASAGVAPNKFLAKIASDENKPDGLFVITPDKAADFAAALPLRKIPGIGKVSEMRLAEHGLVLGADVLSWSEAKLVQKFGQLGASLYWRCRGIDARALQTSRQRKSLGVELTVGQDITEKAQCVDLIRYLLPKLHKRANKHEPRVGINRLGVKLKFSDFNQTTAERKLDINMLEPISAGSELELILSENNFLPLLDIVFSRTAGRTIRLLGLHLGLESQQDTTKNKQLSLDLL